MSGFQYYPPNNFFNNINFNNDFYAVPNNGMGINLAYANTHYLLSSSGSAATSSALTTLFSGSVGIGSTPSGIAGDLQSSTINSSNITAFSLTVTNNMNISKLTLTASTDPLNISSISTSANNAIHFQNNSIYNGYIGIAGTAYGNNYANNLYLESTNSSLILNAGGYSSTPKMIILPSGNIGIGNLNPNNILQVGSGGRLRISNGSNDYTLLGASDIDSLTNSRIVVSGNNRPLYMGNIEYYSTSNGIHKFYTTDSGTERMRIDTNGNVGIGTNNPNCKLYISANLITPASVFAMRLSAGAFNDTNTNATILGLGSEPNGFSKCGIAHVRTSPYDQGDIVFLNRNTADNADCSLSYERMRITSGGNVGIGTNNPVNCKLQVWNGAVNINSGSSYANTNNYMTTGTLTLGSITANYGGGTNWNTNTAALLLECYDFTEINVAVGDSVGGTFYDSLMKYNKLDNTITIGRDCGWGVTDTSIAGKLTGASNVSKRNYFTFTPSQNAISPFNWYYNINLANYISYASAPSSVNYYIFRITINTYTSNYSDTNENCQTMIFNVFLSNFGGGNGTCRIYTVLNSSTGSTLTWINSSTVAYYGSLATGGGSAVKSCIIENIASY